MATEFHAPQDTPLSRFHAPQDTPLSQFHALQDMPLSQFHALQDTPRSASLANKVFIQRDYSEGTTCKFHTKFPPELDNRIERPLFEETLKTLNNFYATAEKIGSQSYLESCLGCASAYMAFLCLETQYDRPFSMAHSNWVSTETQKGHAKAQVLKKISAYIQEQNESVYAPRGLLLSDPIERGMRAIEISIFEDRGSSSCSSSCSSASSGGSQ